MSEKTTNLYNSLKSNKELRQKIDGQKTGEEILVILKENGFDLTMEELTEFEKEISRDKAKKSDETALSVQALEAVAGGNDENSSVCPNADYYCQRTTIYWCNEQAY